MTDEDAKKAFMQNQLAQLRADFVKRLPERMRLIELGWKGLVAQWEVQPLADLHREIHTLIGTSGTFELHELSRSARAFERVLKLQMEFEEAPSPEMLSTLHKSLGQVLVIARQTIEAAGDNEVPEQLPEVGKANLAELERVRTPLVFLVEDERVHAELLAAQLRQFGYDVVVFLQLAAMLQEAAKRRPHVVMLDIILPNCSEEQVFSIARQVIAQQIPVVAISALTDFDTRLKAARAGIIGYQTKPVDLLSLVKRLDKLTNRVPEAPYRVLLIDDQRAVATYHGAVLEQAGMRVRTLMNPLEVMEVLNEFSPDVIVSDVYMPGASGLELAAVLRQQELYDHIPIVFLSGEQDMDKQVSALGIGADDFLVKPIVPDRFISAITARAQRARTLSAVMTHDGLTGLLNHKNIKAAVDKEFARSSRGGDPVVVGLIDVDHFKHVNDTHGHPTGDRVLRGLAHLMKQRLRATDYLGRYGGEEFLIVLPDTPLEAAEKVFNQLREAFASLLYQSEQGEFSSSFSAGLARAIDFPDPSSLLKAADEALYEAKQGGRNQVRIALESQVKQASEE
ncbi:diguanylate cyclase [Atopomonas sediminilitoris]|uniref:diguanylate cyclase n=1 Tax=Atopomonas sediminilitoris TaxID=2919919 RepID=UPI001F4D9BCF|nr:diguanylate cyclase [Atopomonas sediminilitoris]MCJ8169015.1 diguanylate cyclase [Atopomonas sediminilitoris]